MQASFEERLASRADRLTTAIDLCAVLGLLSKKLASHFEPQGKQSTVAVVACGPASLCDDVREEAVYALRTGEWGDLKYVEVCSDWGW